MKYRQVSWYFNIQDSTEKETYIGWLNSTIEWKYGRDLHLLSRHRSSLLNMTIFSWSTSWQFKHVLKLISEWIFESTRSGSKTVETTGDSESRLAESSMYISKPPCKEFVTKWTESELALFSEVIHLINIQMLPRSGPVSVIDHWAGSREGSGLGDEVGQGGDSLDCTEDCR